MFELRVQKGVEPHSFCIGGGIFATSLQSLTRHTRSCGPGRRACSFTAEPGWNRMCGEVLNEPESLNPIRWVMNPDYSVGETFRVFFAFSIIVDQDG